MEKTKEFSVTAGDLLRSSAECQIRSRFTGPDQRVLIRRGYLLSVADLATANAPWSARVEVTKARAIATMLDRPRTNERELPPAVTMEAALMLRRIWTWKNTPDVYFWPGGSRGGRSRSQLPGFTVNGLTVNGAEAIPLLGKRLGERPSLVGGISVVGADEAVIDLCRYAHPIQAWVGATGLMRQFLKYHRSVPAEHRVDDLARRDRLRSKLELVGGSRGVVRGRMVPKQRRFSI